MTSVFKNPIASPLKKESFFYKHRFVFVAFLVPMFLMIYAFYKSQFYPFGDNQIMVIDMWHQYFPFMKVFQDKIQHGGSLLYTWEGGGGSNFIAIISYYAATPLYYLTVFVPAKYLTEAMAFIVILKIAFASAFMYIYLRGIFEHDDMGIVAFSVLYSLSAYAMGYYWCLMWLDVMALLPLCMLGMNKLIDEGKFRLYTVSLALMMITNYYIGVMMCIFIAAYYPILYFSRKEAKGAKQCAVTTGKVVFFSVLGCCMAAIILIPTYLSMQNTYYIDQQGPTDTNFDNPMLDVFSNLLPNVDLTVRGGLPNIYCGLASVVLGLLFLCCRKISAKKRILNCVILAFVMLGFNWNKLNFLWHGNHYPNELPYRFSFAFSFVLVTMACEAYVHLKDITPREIGCVAGGGIIYLIFAEKIYSDKFDYNIIYFSIIFIVLYAVCLAIYKAGKVKQAICGLMLFVVVFAEMTNYTVKSVKTVSHSTRSTYYDHYDEIQALKNKVLDEDKGFYRMEVYNNWTCNDPALYGYRGLTQFSSELNCKVSAMMKYLGLAADPGSNSFRYLLQTPVANSLLNVKYVMARNTAFNQPFFEGRYQKGTSNIYQNIYPLSIGYMVNEDIKQLHLNSDNNVFENQLLYLKLAIGEKYSADIFKSVDSYDSEASSCDGGTLESSDGNNAMVTASAGTPTAHLVYTAEEDGPIYIYVNAENADSVSATVGENGDSVSFENNRGCIASVGNAKQGDTIQINVTFSEGKAGMIRNYVYSLDTLAWEKAYAQLSDEMLNVTDYSDTKIEGTVNAKQNGTLFTSIPYEKGWSAYVDGEKVEVKAINDAFCAIDVKKGKHTIKFSYIPDGFILGVSVSIGSLALMIALFYLEKSRKRKAELIEQIENEDLPKISLKTVQNSEVEKPVENDE